MQLIPVGSRADYALRLVFFAVAPIALVNATALLPISGALVDVGLAVVLVPFAEAVRRHVSSRRWLRLFLGKSLAFDEYYRTHPPRVFLYYVFYPLLFPYWLSQKEARREFLLFKGYNLAGLLILAIIANFRFFRLWQPELSWRAFLPTLAAMLAYEAIIVLAVVMPLATTVVGCLHRGERRRLQALVFVAVVSVGTALVPILRRHDPIVSYETRTRLRLRTEGNGGAAHMVMGSALQRAWKRGEERPVAPEGDGKIEGGPLEEARQALTSFYRVDEAAAFDLWGSPKRHPKLLVLYTEGVRGRAPYWLGLRENGEWVSHSDKLPKGAFNAMRHAER